MMPFAPLMTMPQLPNRNKHSWWQRIRNINSNFSSAVSIGYYKDDFIKYFVPARQQKKDPLMNRGKFIIRL